MDRYRNTRLVSRALLIGFLAFLGSGTAWSQIPNAPEPPLYCRMHDGRSDCEFKRQMSGTPTSVVGNRVILYTRGTSSEHADSRAYSAESLKRLATRYGFTATVTDSPTVFTEANLANTKVVIMSNGDGDVIPTGANRNALQDFQQIHGWGVIWLHAACDSITLGWTWGKQSCVQQPFRLSPSGTQRRIFLDSGTAASPNHGLKNPQTEFLLRSLPGWGRNRAIQWEDEFYCFQKPARNTSGVNVLIGMDRSSGLPDPGCPDAADVSEAGSQNHNLAWTHAMGKGITIYNSIGHDSGSYTSNENAGDSLLWRFIRYAAKDWADYSMVDDWNLEVKPMLDNSHESGPLSIRFTDAGSHVVAVFGLSGRQVFSRTYTGTRAEITDLKRGIYFVRVVSNTRSEVKKFRLF